MRIHALTVTAFGPFAGSQTVAFDELNQAGLFLLTGPTGAGKSSLLDAVCFALYGTVPGSRGVKVLKSQHAPVESRPEVVLDFSVRDRRFVVRRTPEWTRPKRRGEGLVLEKASAVLLETTDGEERMLSSRAAEVGLFLTDLMGMHASQFQQVALLPQGEFQTFLRASSQERHDVLQQLFRTDRFARIEEWVHDRSRQLGERAAAGEAAVRALVERLAERSATPVPDGLLGEALARTAADGRLEPWTEHLLESATMGRTDAVADHEAALEAAAAARTAHDRAVRITEHRVRRDAAVRTLATLEDLAPETAEAAERLDAHGRAGAVRPLLALLREAEQRVDTARRADERARAAADLPDVLDGTDVDHLAATVDAEREQASWLAALLPREREAAEAHAAVATALADLDEVRSASASVSERAGVLPALVAQAELDLADATARAARHEALDLAVTAALRRHEAATALPPAEAEVTRFEDAHREARDRSLDARERAQALTARRLAGMAAELAGDLRDGAPCQVCGSADHPAPAEPGADAVSGIDQDAADEAVSRTTRVLEAAASALQAARHRCDALREAAEGRDVPTAVAELSDAREELDAAAAARTETTGLTRRLADLRAEQATLQQERADTATRLATLQQSVDHHRARAEALDAELAAALVGLEVEDPEGGLAPLVRGLQDRAARLAAALTSGRALEEAQDRCADLRAQAGTTASAHGFDDLDLVATSLLPDPEVARLQRLLRERAEAQAGARAVLADETGSADAEHLIAEVDDARLRQLDDEHVAAERELGERARARHLAEERHATLTSLAARLTDALAAWAPARDRHLTADSMSRLVRGMGQDNQLQMRLSAYVLATRLDQVVAAANERLGHMRDQRYLLQRTGRAASRRSQAGLGLEVVDQWTGDVRDPATLSGGETFLVSLSLALGLADVVTQEAGGVEIDTLFVDEGFGTLDADTLDDVMDRLDGLRAGGRTVGVVSHVSELRNRIPTQVHVDKTRTGSTVAVRTLVG